MTWHDMTWHDMTWHDMTWHDMTWHDMTCSLNVCIGVSLINKNSHHPVTSATLTGDRLFCGDDVICRGAFRCNLLTQTHTALPSRRATCATSRHTYHNSSQWPFVHITLVAIYLSNTLIPNFSERWSQRKSNCPYIFQLVLLLSINRFKIKWQYPHLSFCSATIQHS